MAHLTSPVHGKAGRVYISRPNNFQGDGLNDLTWGTAWDHTSSELIQVEIQEITGTVDLFKWCVDSEAWTEDVAITGAAQELTHGLTVTFGATTGHTVSDSWSNGNLKAEPTTVTANAAQISNEGRRTLKPNAVIVATPTETVNLLSIDYTTGTFYFDGAPGVTTIAGDDAYIYEGYLQVLGYVENWSLTANVAVEDASYMGSDWEENSAGQGSGSISIGKFFISSFSLWEQLAEIAAKKDKLFLQLFVNMPSAQSGTHYFAWAVLSSLGVTTSKNDMIKANLSFTLHGPISPVFDA